MTTAASYSTAVQELYVTYFGRPADYNGLQNFEAALAAANAPTDLVGLNADYPVNGAVKSLIDSFGTSAESIKLYGTLTTSSNVTAFVNAIFENLFNRAPLESGLTYWSDALISGSLTPGDAALAIAAGAEVNASAQGLIDAATVASKVAAASDFTGDLATSGAIGAYAGASAANIGRELIGTVNSATDPADYASSAQQAVTAVGSGTVFTPLYVTDLTTVAETLIGKAGNNIFNATMDNATGIAAGGAQPTLIAGDSITGGPLANTLNIQDDGIGGVSTIPSGVNISRITNLNLNTSETVLNDFSGWAGLSDVNVTVTNSTVNASLTVPAAANVSVSDTTGNVFVSGGASVSISGAVYAAGASQQMLSETGGPSTTSVTFNGGYQDNLVDFNAQKGGINTIATVVLNDVVNANLSSDVLTSLSIAGDVQGGSVYVAAQAAPRTLALNLNGDVNTAISDFFATAMNVTVAGQASTGISLNAGHSQTITFNDAVSLSLVDQSPTTPALESLAATKIVIAGAGAFSADLVNAGASAAIDATASSGAITVDVGSGQSFAGGSGADIVSGSSFDMPIVGGSSGANEIIFNNYQPTGGLNPLSVVSNFSILDVAGSTNGTFDLSKLPGFDAFDVQGTGGAVTFSNIAPGSSLSIDASISGPLTYQSIDSNGANDSVAINLGGADISGISVAQLTVEDSFGSGYGTVNLVSNAASGNANEIGAFNDNHLTNLNLSGNANLSLGIVGQTDTVMTLASQSLHIDNDAGQLGSVISGFSGVFLNSLTFSGSENTQLASLAVGGEGLIVSSSDTQGATVLSIVDSALDTAIFTNSAVTGTLSIGVQANATTSLFPLENLTLDGNVAIAIGAEQVATGVTVDGATDNAAVYYFSINTTAAGNTDSVTLGDGTDRVSLGGGAAGSMQSIVVGNGNDNIFTESQGTVNVTVGNGKDLIAVQGPGSIVNIVAGSGVDSVITANGASGSISFAAHAGANEVQLGSLANANVAPNLANIVAISGLNNAGSDFIVFSDHALNGTGALTNITAAEVNAAAGSAGSLADWVATAVGQGGVVPQVAHSASWFQFQGNTYLVETVTASDAGVVNAADTVVELTGLGYTFNHPIVSNGLLILQG